MPLSPIEKRRVDNETLRADTARFSKDMKKANITENQIKEMVEKKVPLGFRDRKQFEKFKKELDVALRKDGLDDADIRMKGTSTTFYSENPGKPLGHHWDADPEKPGDYDLNITSKTMVERMETESVTPNPKYDIFSTRDVERLYPALDTFAKTWSRELDRDVNFVGYPKPRKPDATEFTLR